VRPQAFQSAELYVVAMPAVFAKKHARSFLASYLKIKGLFSTTQPLKPRHLPFIRLKRPPQTKKSASTLKLWNQG
jgi:hypothetical protein